MERNNQNGSYAIQEQGDLGLGLNKISEKYVDKETGKINIPKNDSTGFTGRRDNKWLNVGESKISPTNFLLRRIY